jgi:hypothetical protein
MPDEERFPALSKLFQRLNSFPFYWILIAFCFIFAVRFFTCCVSRCCSPIRWDKYYLFVISKMSFRLSLIADIFNRKVSFLFSYIKAFSFSKTTPSRVPSFKSWCNYCFRLWWNQPFRLQHFSHSICAITW